MLMREIHTKEYVFDEIHITSIEIITYDGAGNATTEKCFQVWAKQRGTVVELTASELYALSILITEVISGFRSEQITEVI